MAVSTSVVVDNLITLREENRKEKLNFKVKAYDKVILQIRQYATRFDLKILTEKDVDAIEDISNNMRAKIKEIVKTGELEQVKKLNPKALEATKAVTNLANVMGIGPSIAKQLYDKFQIQTVEGLKEFAKDKSNTYEFTHAQLLGIEHYDDLQKRIPYKEMLKHQEFIKNIIGNAYEFEIVGSFRRQAKHSGDIDLLVKVKDDQKTHLDKIITSFKKYIVGTTAHGDKKFMGLCKLPKHRTVRRLDVITVTEKHYPFMVLYFTGSQAFNIEMRNIANEKGFRLNEYGFVAITNEADTMLKSIKHFKCEKDIFDFLCLEYVDPDKRTDHALITTTCNP